MNEMRKLMETVDRIDEAPKNSVKLYVIWDKNEGYLGKTWFYGTLLQARKWTKLEDAEKWRDKYMQRKGMKSYPAYANLDLEIWEVEMKETKRVQ